jgi:hypothetical protein
MMSMLLGVEHKTNKQQKKPELISVYWKQRVFDMRYHFAYNRLLHTSVNGHLLFFFSFSNCNGIYVYVRHPVTEKGTVWYGRYGNTVLNRGSILCLNQADAQVTRSYTVQINRYIQ